MTKLCVYCEKELTGRKLKYCNDNCQFRYTSIKKDAKPKRFSVAQHLRMARAGRAQRLGRIGVRFN